jgi:hypothetical protein
MMNPTWILRGAHTVALSLLVTLAACGSTSAPTVTTTATGTPVATATIPAPSAAGAPPAPATTGTPTAAPVVATAVRAATPATPVMTVTARVRPPASAPTVAPPTATPRGYAPDDPCAPYVAGALPPSGRAVVAAPARLCIPALALSAPVVPVGVTPAGAMAEPEDPLAVGWYAPGPPPGALGNAALDGKVDVRGIGPAIFWDLARLRPGDGVVIVDRAGTARRFEVTETAIYRREDAPLGRVFGPADDANLALVTGAGTWDPATATYDSNLIVFARLQP